MKRLVILIGFCIAITVLFSMGAGSIFAAGQTWTATGVTFPVKHSQETTKTVGKKTVEVITTTTVTYSGGTVTLNTDTNQDPASAGSPGCYISLGGKEGTTNTTICINSLEIVSRDLNTGEKGAIVGTGTITEGSASGIIFLRANWSQTPKGIPTSITLSAIKLSGGTGGTSGNGGSLISASVPSITLK